MPHYGHRKVVPSLVKERVNKLLLECFQLVEACDARFGTDDLFGAAQSATDLKARSASLGRAIDCLSREMRA